MTLYLVLLLALAFLSGMGLGYGLNEYLLGRYPFQMLPRRATFAVLRAQLEHLIQTPEGRSDYAHLVEIWDQEVAEQKRHEGVN